MKRFLSIIGIFIIVGFLGILYGCGDKYANLSISVTTTTARDEDGSLTMYMGEGVADSEVIAITMQNAPGDFNYIPFFSMSNEIIKINADNELIDNGVKKVITAVAPGKTTLTVYTSEGGKSTTLNINVVKVASSIKYKDNLKFGIVRDYGATLQIDYRKHLEIYPEDSNQREVRYSIESYVEGGVEKTGSPDASELFVNARSGLVTILDKNTEITSFKVQARIDNSKTLNKDGTPLPDIINDSSVEVHIVNKIVSNDITLYEAGDMAEITLPDSPTEEDLAKLDSITVKNDTVKTLIKNIEDINFVNVIIKVKTIEDITISYPTDLTNIPVMITENNIFSGYHTYFDRDAGYRYFAYRITATRATTLGDYVDGIFNLQYAINYTGFVVDGYPIVRTQKIVCDSYIKTFSVNDTTVVPNGNYALKVYKTDYTAGSVFKIAVANPLSITAENSKFKLKIYKRVTTGAEPVDTDITDGFETYFSLRNTQGNVTNLEDSVFDNGTIFYVKANSLLVSVGDVFIFKVMAYHPNETDAFLGLTPEQILAKQAVANVVATITQGIESVDTYSYTMQEWDEVAGDYVDVDYEGTFDIITKQGDREISIDNLHTKTLDVNIAVGPVGADVSGLSVMSSNTKIVDATIVNGVMTLKAVSIGEAVVTISANTLLEGYKIKVNVYNPIEKFTVNLQNSTEEAGVGKFERTDNSLTSVTSKLGSYIYLVLTTEPTTAEYKELVYEVTETTDFPYVPLTKDVYGVFGNDNFLFDSENLYFVYSGTNAVGKTYSITVKIVNFDGSVITQTFTTECYIPVSFTASASKSVIYNPLGLNYEEKTDLHADECKSSFYIRVEENADATYNFANYGHFEVSINGEVNNNFFVTPTYDEEAKVYWFVLDESKMGQIISYPQLVYISVQINELGRHKTDTLYVLLKDPEQVVYLTALDTDSSELYFKKGLTADKDVSIMVSPTNAENRELYLRQYIYNKDSRTYTDVTDALTGKVFEIEETLTTGAGKYIYKYKIKTASPDLVAGTAILLILPKDKVNVLDEYQKLTQGNMNDAISIWDGCLAFTIIAADGTKANPYHVSSAKDLREIGESEVSLTKYYVQTSDILVGENWEPIGQELNISFSGGYDAKYTFVYVKTGEEITTYSKIKGLTYTNAYSVLYTFGLFHKLAAEGEISNVDLTYSYINAKFNDIIFGGVAAINFGTITNAKVNYTNAIVESAGNMYFGGIVGKNTAGKILNTDLLHAGVSGTISLKIMANKFSYIGGVAGESTGIDAKIIGSVAEPGQEPVISYGNTGFDSSITLKVDVPTLAVTTAVGGIVGYNESIVENCAVQGKIYAPAINNVGGIVGSAYYAADFVADNTYEGIRIRNSYSCASVYGNENVGGAIGAITGYNTKIANISYSSAENYYDVQNKDRIFITGKENVGGFVGSATFAKIENCYAVTYYNDQAITEWDMKVLSQGNSVGGFAGYLSDTTTLSICASDINIDNSAGSVTNVGGFVGSINGTGITATNFFARGKSASSASAIVASGNFTTKTNYYSTFNTVNTIAAANTDMSATLPAGWVQNAAVNNNLPYLLDSEGRMLFATAPLTVSVVVKDNNQLGMEGEYEKYIADVDNEEGAKRAAVVFLNSSSKLTQAEINQLNTLSIADFADMQIIPLTSRSARLVVVSSDPNVVKVNADGTLSLIKEGTATITISSKLNANYKTSVYLIVKNGVTEFIISSNSNLEADLKENQQENPLTVLKTTTKSLYVGVDYKVEVNGFDTKVEVSIDNIADTDVGANSFGVRYIVLNSDLTQTLTGTDVPNISSLFNINGWAWISDADSYYVDVPYITNTIIKPINATGEIPCKIIVLPYITTKYVSKDGMTTNENVYLYRMQTSFYLEIKKGATEINATDAGTTMQQLASKKVVVVIETDYEDDQVVLTNFVDLTKATRTDRLQIVNGLQQIVYDENGKVIQIRAEFTITYANKEIMLLENKDYVLVFQPLSNPAIRHSYNVTIKPQGVLDVDFRLYSRIDDYKDKDGTKTNVIYNGQIALLAVEVYPYFSKYDSMEILYSTPVSNSLTIVQFKYDAENETFSDYPDSGAIYDRNIGLKINKATGADTFKDNENGIYSYTKVYFFGLLVGSDVPDYTQFNIRVKFYSAGVLVEPFDAEYEFTAVSQPTVALAMKDKSLQDMEGTYRLPLGTTNDMNVELKNYIGDIEWTVTSLIPDFVLTKAMEIALTPKLVNGVYKIEIPGGSEYWDLLGKKFNIKATIYKDDFVSTDDINVEVTLFTIQKIEVEGVSNDYLSIPVYTTTTLNLKAKYFVSETIEAWYGSWRVIYNTQYVEDHGYDLPLTFESYINQFILEMSKQEVWYYVLETGLGYGKLAFGNSYLNDLFEVSDYNGQYGIYGYRVDVTTQMKLIASVAYKDGVPSVAKEDIADFAAKQTYNQDFNMVFVYKHGLINAIPVSTQKDFETMEEGKDYRLVNDIVLKNYTPISTPISTFDGNNYTIYITGFNYPSTHNENAYLSLFETVSEETTLYNVKVCYTEKITALSIGISDKVASTSVSTNPLSVSLIQAPLVYFGGICITNNGAITNATVGGKINIEVNYNAESGVAIASTLNGGICSTNNGYITNSKVEKFEFSGYGYTGGIVGINEKIITSTYANELKIVNKSSNFTGGFVYKNGDTTPENASIQSCYVQGQRLSSDLAIRNQGAGIQSSGQVAGFVYESNGTISDCYTNISLASSSFLAGFVFTGSTDSVINNSYSICKRLGTNNATDSPFCGGNTGTSVKAPGTITNCYYYSEGWAKFNGEVAIGLTADQFATSSEFVTFDMAIDSVEQQYVNGKGIYNVADGYTWVMIGGKPVLVATLADTYSQMNYAGKSKIYSDVNVLYKYDGVGTRLAINPVGTSYTLQWTDGTNNLSLTYDLTRLITNRMITYKVVHLTLDDAEKHGGHQTIWVEENEVVENGKTYSYYIYMEDNVFKDSTGKRSDGTSVEEHGNLKNIHYKVTGALYNGNEIEVALDLENNYRANDTVECEYSADSRYITKISYQVCESAQYYYTDYVAGESEISGTATNPYLIYDYNSFTSYLSSNAKGGVYFRFVRDIDLAYKTPTTVYTAFNGIIQGNHMTVQNVSISYLSSQETAIPGYGLFAEIVSTTTPTTISNLNIEVYEIASSSHPFVGALAGQTRTEGSSSVLLSNIKVTMAESEGYVLGKNFVGGVIGYAKGNTQIKKIYADVWVNATRDFYQYRNQYHVYQILTLAEFESSDEDTKKAIASKAGIKNSEIPNYTSEEIVEMYNEKIISYLSYAGGVVGAYDANQIFNYNTEEYNANDVSVGQHAIVVGVVAGGVFGFVGEETSVKDAKVKFYGGEQYIGAVTYAGGIAGENRGKISSSAVTTSNLNELRYGKKTTESFFFEALNNTSIVAIGGIVGMNIGSTDEYGVTQYGIIENSLAQIDVRNEKALIGGGAVGRMIGGKLSGVIASGSVMAKNIIGGLVGTVNQSSTVVYRPENTFGFIYQKSQDLLLPRGTADKAVFNNNVATNNWLFEDYAYLSSDFRLVAGFIGLEVQEDEIESGVADSEKYYSDFANVSANEINFYSNALYQVSTTLANSYLPVLYGGSQCDVYEVKHSYSDNAVKSVLNSEGQQVVYPYGGDEMYMESPDSYTFVINNDGSTSSSNAQRDERISFNSATNTIVYGSTVTAQKTTLVATDLTITVDGIDYVIGQKLAGDEERIVVKIVIYAEGTPLAITGCDIYVRASIGEAKWTVTKTYNNSTDLIINDNSLSEDTLKLTAASNPVYLNGVYHKIGQVLADGSVVKEITIHSTESVLNKVDVSYEYDVANNEFATETRRAEGSASVYTLSVTKKQVAYKYLSENYWSKPNNFYNTTVSNVSYFPNINLFLNVKNWITFAATSYAGGSGTAADPLLISTPEQLAYLAKQVNIDGAETTNVYYRITRDIDLSGKYWTPIGTKDRPFEGVFDAGIYNADGEFLNQINTIYYAMVDEDSNGGVKVEYAGLFGYVKGGFSKLQNITTVGGNIEGVVAGGLVGYYESPNQMSNITNGNTVTGFAYAGGVVGIAHNSSKEVKVTNAINNGTIFLKTQPIPTFVDEIDYGAYAYNQKYYVGGIAGLADIIAYEQTVHNYGQVVVQDEMTNYISSTPLKAQTYVGGVVGYLIGSPAKKTYNNAKISVSSNADKLYVGGVVGYCENIYTDGTNRGYIYLDYKTIDAVNTGYAAETKAGAGGFEGTDDTAIASFGGVVGYAQSVQRCANENKIELICEYNTRSIISLGGVLGTAKISSTSNTSLSENSNVAIIEAQVPNTSTICLVGGVVGSLLWTDGCKIINVANNYNTGDIISPSTCISISGGIFGAVRGIQAIEGYKYNLIGQYPTNSLMNPDFPTQTFVKVFFNYNLGSVSVTGGNLQYCATGGIAGYVSNTIFYDADATYKSNIYLTGTAEGNVMSYDIGSGQFVYSDVEEVGCKNMLLTTMHNELLSILTKNGTIEDYWDVKYESWFPTLKNNTSEVLWENYRENFYISGGTYMISSAEELAYLAYQVNAGLISTEGKTYKLANQINLENKYFTPIGTAIHPFKGTFDGNGYIIKNLTIDGGVSIAGKQYLNTITMNNITDTYAGLFGFVQDASIRNVGLEAVYINNVGFAGGLAYSVENSEVSHVYTETLKYGEDEGVRTTVDVTARYFAAGLIGNAVDNYPSEENNFKAGIYNSFNNLRVRNTNNGYQIAGIARIKHSYVENCYNKGTLTMATTGSTGPVVQFIEITDATNYVNYCYNIGHYVNDSEPDPLLCYTNNNGGLVNDSTHGEPTILNLKANGWDMANDWTSEYTLNEFDPDEEVSEYYPSLRGLGQDWKSTEAEDLIMYTKEEIAAMESFSKYTINNINYVDEEAGTEIGDEIPKYYLIETPEQLAWLSRKVNEGTLSTLGKEFILVNDLDLSGKYWTPIGRSLNYSFRGTFNFNGHTISGLTIDSKTLGYAGLFGYVKDATICDGYIDNAYVRLASDDNTVDLCAGTLVANATDTIISNIAVSTTLGVFSSKFAIAGGLVGEYAVTKQNVLAEYAITNVRVNPHGALSLSEYEQWVTESSAPLEDGGDGGSLTADSISVGAFSNGSDVYAGGIVAKVRGIYTSDLSMAKVSYATNNNGVAGISTSNTADAYVGGISGRIEEYSIIQRSTNNGMVKSHSGMHDRVGGIVGYIYESRISDCMNTAYVECTRIGHTLSYIGGIVGYGEEIVAIDNCINYGTTRKNYSLAYAIWGGILGHFEGYNDDYFTTHEEWLTNAFVLEYGYEKCVGNVSNSDTNVLRITKNGLPVTLAVGVTSDVMEKGGFENASQFSSEYWSFGAIGANKLPELSSKRIKIVCMNDLFTTDEYVMNGSTEITKTAGEQINVAVIFKNGIHKVSHTVALNGEGKLLFDVNDPAFSAFDAPDGETEIVNGNFNDTVVVYFVLQ